MNKIDSCLDKLNNLNSSYKKKVDDTNNKYNFIYFNNEPKYNISLLRFYDDYNMKSYTRNITPYTNIIKFINHNFLKFHNYFFDDNEWIKINSHNFDLIDNLIKLDINNKYLINSISPEKINASELNEFKDILYKYFNNINIFLEEYKNSNTGCNFYWVIISY